MRIDGPLPPEPLFTAPAPYFNIPTAESLSQVKGMVPDKLIGKVMEIWIQGVDCPDKSDAVGKAARHFLVDQAFMNDVQVEISGTKPDGALVGKVNLANGRNLGEELIKQGLAWWDKPAAPDESGLAKLELQAREANMGIWTSARLTKADP